MQAASVESLRANTAADRSPGPLRADVSHGFLGLLRDIEAHQRSHSTPIERGTEAQATGKVEEEAPGEEDAKAQPGTTAATAASVGPVPTGDTAADAPPTASGLALQEAESTDTLAQADGRLVNRRAVNNPTPGTGAGELLSEETNPGSSQALPSAFKGSGKLADTAVDEGSAPPPGTSHVEAAEGEEIDPGTEAEAPATQSRASRSSESVASLQKLGFSVNREVLPQETEILRELHATREGKKSLEVAPKPPTAVAGAEPGAPARAEMVIRSVPPSASVTLPEPPVEIVVRGVHYLLNKGEQTVTMRLVPASLGELHLEVLTVGDEVRVRIATASPGVRESITSQLIHLRESLQKDGLIPGRIEILTTLDSGPGNQHSPASQQSMSGNTPHKASLPILHHDRQAQEETSRRPQTPQVPGSINIFV